MSSNTVSANTTSNVADKSAPIVINSVPSERQSGNAEAFFKIFDSTKSNACFSLFDEHPFKHEGSWQFSPMLFIETLRGSQDYEKIIYGKLVAMIKSKFGASKYLQRQLLMTGSKTIVYCSEALDFGIGWASDTVETENPGIWKGRNLYGLALMTVRNDFRENWKKENLVEDTEAGPNRKKLKVMEKK